MGINVTSKFANTIRDGIGVFGPALDFLRRYHQEWDSNSLDLESPVTEYRRFIGGLDSALAALSPMQVKEWLAICGALLANPRERSLLIRFVHAGIKAKRNVGDHPRSTVWQHYLEELEQEASHVSFVLLSFYIVQVPQLLVVGVRVEQLAQMYDRERGEKKLKALNDLCRCLIEDLYQPTVVDAVYAAEYLRRRKPIPRQVLLGRKVNCIRRRTAKYELVDADVAHVRNSVSHVYGWTESDQFDRVVLSDLTWCREFGADELFAYCEGLFADVWYVWQALMAKAQAHLDNPAVLDAAAKLLGRMLRGEASTSIVDQRLSAWVDEKFAWLNDLPKPVLPLRDFPLEFTR